MIEFAVIVVAAALICGLLIGDAFAYPRCAHRWTEERVIKVYDPDVSMQHPAAHKVILRCTRCGDQRARRL